MHQKSITAGRGSAQSGNYLSSELLKLETTERDTREILDRLAAIKAEAQNWSSTWPFYLCFLETNIQLSTLIQYQMGPRYTHDVALWFIFTVADG